VNRSAADPGAVACSTLRSTRTTTDGVCAEVKRQARRRYMTKKQKNALDKKIEQIYYASCRGVQINIMDIEKVFDVGYKALAEGANDETLKAKIVAFVETIRFN
jgi:hypothetical protein